MIRRALENTLIELFCPLRFAIGMEFDCPLQNASNFLIPGIVADGFPVPCRRAGAKRWLATGVFRSCPWGHKGARIEWHVGEIRLAKS
jgi:hypothetical protein